MHLREWKCTCPLVTEEDFIQYLHETGVKDTQVIDACTSYQILRRELNKDVEITFITYWETLESMKDYAGCNLYKAVLYPEDEKYCIQSETEVRVFEIIETLISSTE